MHQRGKTIHLEHYFTNITMSFGVLLVATDQTEQFLGAPIESQGR